MPLCSLMEGIYYIGTNVCPDTPNRLFAHQIGDGFILVSEFAERSPEFPLAIGVFLLRQILLAGGMGKCAVSQGKFGDITGCYPDLIRNASDDSGIIHLGAGLMRLFPVMGSALINSYRLGKLESGSLLLVDSDLGPLPSDAIVLKATSDYFVVDWVHTQTKELSEIESKTGIKHPSDKRFEDLVKDYMSLYGSSLPPNWSTNTLRLNGC